MSMKKLKNDLRDFPNPYDEKYLTDDGKIMIQPFIKDYYTAVHQFYSKLEVFKQNFPISEEYANDLMEDYKETTVPEAELSTIIKVIEWYKKYIGYKGTGNGVLGLSR